MNTGEKKHGLLSVLMFRVSVRVCVFLPCFAYMNYVYSFKAAKQENLKYVFVALLVI